MSAREGSAAGLPERALARGRATVNDAIRAWFGGEFERCIDLCDRVRRRDAETIAQVALIRARALLRLGRAAEAKRVVSDTFVVHGALDSSLTAQMLLGEAHVRLGDRAAGLAILERAQAAATEAHPTIRSEIALHRALGHYGDRDLDRAEAALSLVCPEADIVFARALEFGGWVSTARGDHALAVKQFVAALEHLDRCRADDRFLAANCLHVLAINAAERMDIKLWSLVEKRAEQIDWSASGLAVPRFWIRMYAVAIYEMNGDSGRAFRAARQAEGLAPTAAGRVVARCRRAALSRDVGEPFSQYDHTEAAWEAYRELDPDRFDGDDRFLPLALVPELAFIGMLDEARAVLAGYRSRAGASRMMALADDPRLQGMERMVDGILAEAAGIGDEAQAAYRDAFSIFNRTGYKRRAVIAAIRLANITGQTYLYEYAAIATRGLSAESWMRRQIAHREPLYRDDAAKRLTAGQREILMLVCAGLSNAEIARRRNRSLNTTRNSLHEIFKTFDVRSRSELVAECVRRGIYGHSASSHVDKRSVRATFPGPRTHHAGGRRPNH